MRHGADAVIVGRKSVHISLFIDVKDLHVHSGSTDSLRLLPSSLMQQDNNALLHKQM